MHAANDRALKYIKLEFDRLKGAIAKPYSLLGYFSRVSHKLIEAAKIEDLQISEICHSQQIPVNQICTCCAI